LRLKKNLISCKVDDSGQSIGKRYARTDEIGIPFGITIDFQTLDEKSVTLRELFTMKQLRVPLDDIDKVLLALSQGS
jgi:glycyl-tRNA synthetase